MQVVGIFLMIVSIWSIYCGIESFNPLAVALAILQNAGNAQAVIDQAKSEVSQSLGQAPGSVLNQTSSAEALAGAPGSNPAAPGVNAHNPGATNAGATKASYQAYAQTQLASKYGITDPAQMTALIKLWNQESGWNPQALNASSGAFGIPQALPANKIPGGRNAGAQAQIDWGLQYIIQRYGSPANAWAHEVANNWY